MYNKHNIVLDEYIHGLIPSNDAPAISFSLTILLLKKKLKNIVFPGNIRNYVYPNSVFFLYTLKNFSINFVKANLVLL